MLGCFGWQTNQLDPYVYLPSGVSAQGRFSFEIVWLSALNAVTLVVKLPCAWLLFLKPIFAAS